MKSHGEGSHPLADLVGGTIVVWSEAGNDDEGRVRLSVRTASGKGVQVDFSGVSTRALENVGGTVIADVREVPAPTPYRQFVLLAEPGPMRRTIKILAQGVRVTADTSLDAPPANDR